MTQGACCRSQNPLQRLWCEAMSPDALACGRQASLSSGFSKTVRQLSQGTRAAVRTGPGLVLAERISHDGQSEATALHPSLPTAMSCFFTIDHEL